LTGKDLYRRLGKKLDTMPMRAPWNDALYGILKELYSAEEADLVIRMPYGLSSIHRLEKAVGLDRPRLSALLETACTKGLVIDICVNGKYYFGPSPMVVGIFEFTMMRTGNPSAKKMAGLFHEYMETDEAFYKENFGRGEQISVLRTLPHEEAVGDGYTEILGYESAQEIIRKNKRFAIGLCSCRHEKEHLGRKGCDVPLSTCSSFGLAADYVIRRGAAREVSKEEMLESLGRSRELGLVLSADNVRRNVNFLCHCCGCCCHALRGIREKGYANPVVTSGFVAETDEEKCVGCGLCARDCPIDAVAMEDRGGEATKRKKISSTDLSLCLGCGVCILSCRKKARTLVQSGRRVILPETTFERILLQSLERGTLQHQLFDDPQRITHAFMRGLLGAFLRLPPVKKALMSDALRSRFLDSMKHAAAARGMGWMSKI
jgi:ferredoxin